MAYIYKITNQINGKVYIGKTLKPSIQERWKEHLNDYIKKSEKKRPLYDAMRKYGPENFFIEEIEKCSDKEVNDREVYWIEYYKSFKEGYNATRGGDGKAYLDYDLIIATYKEIQNISLTAKQLNVSTDSISRILKENNVLIKPQNEINKEQKGFIVNQYSLNDDFIQTFISLGDAARAVRPHSKSISGISSHIADVCRNKRKSAYGFHWKFAE